MANTSDKNTINQKGQTQTQATRRANNDLIVETRRINWWFKETIYIGTRRRNWWFKERIYKTRMEEFLGEQHNGKEKNKRKRFGQHME